MFNNWRGLFDPVTFTHKPLIISLEHGEYPRRISFVEKYKWQGYSLF